MTTKSGQTKIKTFCALCIARCGAIATIEEDRLVALEPDPSHPTGTALCAKGRAARELIYSPDRLRFPMKRTKPKGDPNTGWTRIGWDEALDFTTAAMQRIAEQHGPEAVAFTQASGSTTSIGDAGGWIRRLMNAFGTPNAATNVELCGWGRAFATRYTYGVGSVGIGSGGGAMPDIDNAGCLILWGYNPSMSRLTHGMAVAEGLKRGMRLIVIDPRHVGLASKADVWMRVRPGTDGALALGLANLMIERGWYDRQFLRKWSNGPMLVRNDTGRLLTEWDLRPNGSGQRYCAWDTATDSPSIYDPATGCYECDGADLALEGTFNVETAQGQVMCRPAFEMFAALCRRYPPETIEETCWIERAQLEQAAELIWSARPTAYYAWSGHEQHTNTTQTARALSLLYALTGSFDKAGGNVLFPTVPNASVSGEDLPAAQSLAPALGVAERPLGPARWNHITSRDLYRAILEGKPYPVRGLVGFGANILVAHAGPLRGREALSALDFYVHADMFMNPTAEFADVILPVASPFERDALKLGFEIGAEAQSRIQFRTPLVAPVGECKSDAEIIFALAQHLGLSGQFWDGDLDAAYRHQLAPSGLTLEALRDTPGGIRVDLQTTYEKHAQTDADGIPQGFATPSGKIEIWSEIFLENGYSALPEYEELIVGPVSRPDLAAQFPLILTSAKNTLFCNSQHRGLPSLRKRHPDPTVELHPDCAAARGITAGDWVEIASPDGAMRARAQLNPRLDPRIVIGQHGWWQACDALEAPSYDPFSAAGSNYNMLIGTTALDPISGTASHKGYLCDVRATD
jgi:anaerobic selenocysteine-containing dehydrogenase